MGNCGIPSCKREELSNKLKGNSLPMSLHRTLQSKRVTNTAMSVQRFSICGAEGEILTLGHSCLFLTLEHQYTIMAVKPASDLFEIRPSSNIEDCATNA